jgi:hypothetical protein
LDDLIQHIAILIHGPPEPVLPAGNADDHLVKVPNIAPVRPLAFEAAGVVWPELQRPPANSLIGYDYPRSSSISSTKRRLNGNLKQSHTAWAMISGGKR